MARKISIGTIIAILIGIILIIASYLIYIFAVPPFYTIETTTTNPESKTLDIPPQSEVKIWLLNKTVETEEIICKPDINYSFTLKVTSLSTRTTPKIPVNVTVFVAGSQIYSASVSDENDFKFQKSFNGSLPLFPGVWRFGLEIPLEHGYEIYAKITNNSNETARVNIRVTSGEVAYRVSNNACLFIFVFGVIIMSLSIVHAAYSFYTRSLEEKVKKALEEETS